MRLNPAVWLNTIAQGLLCKIWEVYSWENVCREGPEYNGYNLPGDWFVPLALHRSGPVVQTTRLAHRELTRWELWKTEYNWHGWSMNMNFLCKLGIWNTNWGFYFPDISRYDDENKEGSKSWEKVKQSFKIKTLFKLFFILPVLTMSIILYMTEYQIKQVQWL